MTTRVFRGRSLHHAQQAATLALGDDAVVLTTREVKRSGIFGLFGATEIEIAAASLPKTLPALPAPKGPFAAGAYFTEARVAPPQKDHLSKAAVVNSLRADLRNEIRAVKLAMAKPSARHAAENLDLMAEVSAIRDVLDQLTPSPARGNKLAALLRMRGIEGKSAAAISRALKGPSQEALDERLRGELRKMISTAPWSLPARGQRAVVSAVGPSGVGKTTTLAKLATLAKADGRTVAFVTSDTFRVGGVEHVRRYASLLEIAFETVTNPDELEAFVGRTNADLVFVDTSGRAPRANAAELLLAQKAFSESDACTAFERHVLLCLPGACREVDVQHTLRSFSITSPTALALTKLDETRQPSGILHAAWVTRLPLALTCAGQRVPEDLDPADLDLLVERIVPSAKSAKDKAA